MKTKIRSRYALLLFCLLMLCANSLLTADSSTTIQTPKGTSVAALLLDELSAGELASMNNQATTLYPNAILLASSSRTYNCHAYAWHVSEGGGHVWLNAPNQYSYWNDGSYGEVAAEAQATKVSYASDDHSAVTTTQAGWFNSKWGKWPLMRHAWNDCPYDSTQLKYYAPSLNVIYAPTSPAANNNIVVAVKTWKGSLVPGAAVALTKDGQGVGSQLTANAYPDLGTAKFSFSLTAGTLAISVTKSSYSSYSGTSELVSGIGQLWISLHGGMTAPYDEWYASTACFNAIVNLEYHFLLPWAWVLELAYNDFLWKDPKQHFPWWNVSGTVRYYLPTKRLKPFVNLGPGLYIPHEGDIRFGAKIGLGVDYAISDRINIEFGTDYHYIFKGRKNLLNQNKKMSFQHFHAGITFNL